MLHSHCCWPMPESIQNLYVTVLYLPPITHASQQVFLVLTYLLEHIHKNEGLRKQHGPAAAKLILSHWTQLSSWWGGSTSKLSVVSLLKKLLLVFPEVSFLPFRLQ